jgi:hypothetical protein
MCDPLGRMASQLTVMFTLVGTSIVISRNGSVE